MEFLGFTNEDFDVFLIDGLEARMVALKEKIRPKLDSLGEYFAPALTVLTGDEMFAHTAKHARRTKNPPNDTWVAFANNPRGYKMLPHFQIGLWKTHLFVWFAVIYEAPNKEVFGRKFEEHLDKIIRLIPGDFVWSVDHTKTSAVKHQELSKRQLQQYFQNLQKTKKAEILCGVQIDRSTAVMMKPDELAEKCERVFTTLADLYKIL